MTSAVVATPAPRSGAERAVALVFAVVAVVSTSAGVTMILSPEDTDSNFAWALGPPPLASLVAGLYLAAGVVFGWGATLRWPGQRGVCAAVLALTIPTFVFTLVHEEIFDFSRFFAVFWLFLFLAAPLAAALLLYALRDAGTPGGGARLPERLRLGATVLALIYLIAAVALFADPVGVGDAMPFALPEMGGRFIGSFALALAVLAAWPVARGRDEAFLPLLGLAVWPAGGVVAALRHLDDLEPSGARAGWIILLVALGLAGAALLAWERRTA